MRVLAAFALCVAGCAAVGVTQDYYITSPYDAVVWKAGKDVTITWNIERGGYPADSITVELMDGPDNGAQVIQTLATGLPVTSKSFTWTVPADFKTNNHVFVRLTGVNLADKTGWQSVMRYSHRFTIIGGEGVESTTSKKTAPTTTRSSTKTSSTSSTTSESSATPSTVSEETSTTRDRVRIASSARVLDSDALVRWTIWTVLSMAAFLYVL